MGFMSLSQYILGPNMLGLFDPLLLLCTHHSGYDVMCATVPSCSAITVSLEMSAISGSHGLSVHLPQ